MLRVLNTSFMLTGTTITDLGPSSGSVAESVNGGTLTLAEPAVVAIYVR